MAVLKMDLSRRTAKPENTTRNPLAGAVREFDRLVLAYEAALLCSVDDDALRPRPRDQRARWRDEARNKARRLALADLETAYTRKHIRRSLADVESLGKSVEEQLHVAPQVTAVQGASLDTIYNGHFRLHSTHLFDLLGQPTDLRFGTLRFHDGQHESPRGTSLELALNSAFFVADSTETMPYHCFTVPETPSPINRGILSRKPSDNGEWPDFDSWLLLTFLGNGCLKVEIPIEMCADVYGGRLRGRENEEIVFWGVFVPDECVY
jgi:hypothetical protein